MKRYAIETGILLIAATACALVANAMASRERKLAVVGSYGSPTRVAAASMAPDWVATREGEPSSSDAFESIQIEALTASVPAAEIASDLAPVETPSAAAPAAAEPSRPAVETPARPPVEPASSAPRSAAPAAQPAQNAAKASRADLLRRFPPEADKPWVEISGADAMWLHRQGTLFLDARRTSTYEQGHIAGARSFSVWESDVDDKVAGLLEQVSDQQLPIVVYCSGGACEDSHMLSQKLWGLFFENVLVYKDGFPDWQNRGGSVRTGAKP